MDNITAIILCGGKGSRLRPYTENRPKPMVEIQGKPILGYILKTLSKSGIRKFLVCVGYKAELIEEFVNTNKEPDWDITCINSGEDASITERILDCRKHIQGKTLICYGDTLAQLNLDSLCEQHKKNNALATLSVFPLKSPFGIVSFDSNMKVTGFLEKPELPYWINIGFMLCEREAIFRVSKDQDMVEFLKNLAKTNAFYVYQHKGRHLTVNTEKELKEANQLISDFFTLWEDRVA